MFLPDVSDVSVKSLVSRVVCNIGGTLFKNFGINPLSAFKIFKMTTNGWTFFV